MMTELFLVVNASVQLQTHNFRNADVMYGRVERQLNRWHLKLQLCFFTCQRSITHETKLNI